MADEPRPALGSLDRELLRRAQTVVGIDEVGRGALAGPVVVGGVAFDRIPFNPGIQDSKLLTPRQRARAATWVRATCVTWTVVEVWVDVIDRINILEATRLAMRAVSRTLSTAQTAIVVDHVDLAERGADVLSIQAADAKFFCVAAASIVAKVHRDNLMARLDRDYPGWDWEGNKGYGTRRHRVALESRGRSFLHRTTFSWSPVLP